MATGRCYCGHVQIAANAAAETVTYCHCDDCKRWTGSPLPAFAAFSRGRVVLSPDVPSRSIGDSVTRWNCPVCGSPLAAEFAYLPNQTYVPLGILDTAADLAPERHAHTSNMLPWLHLEDDLPRDAGSARDALNAARSSS